jgi:hypothetical protein
MQELVSSTKFDKYSSVSSSPRNSVQIGGNKPINTTKTNVIPSYTKKSQTSIKMDIVSNKIFEDKSKIESLKQDIVSNKIFEDMSKIESLRQIDFLPDIVTRDDLKKSLLELEKKYDMSSEKFYSDYKQGKAEDNFDSLKWAILYELWMQKYLMQV